MVLVRGGQSEGDVRKPERARRLERAAPGSVPESGMDWEWARQGREHLQGLLRWRADKHGLYRRELQPLGRGRQKVCLAEMLLRTPSVWGH